MITSQKGRGETAQSSITQGQDDGVSPLSRENREENFIRKREKGELSWSRGSTSRKPETQAACGRSETGTNKRMKRGGTFTGGRKEEKWDNKGKNDTRLFGRKSNVIKSTSATNAEKEATARQELSSNEKGMTREEKTHARKELPKKKKKSRGSCFQREGKKSAHSTIHDNKETTKREEEGNPAVVNGNAE